ncbi:MAG: peptide ABC transporter substrate-binding protein [Clostridia bacterium]|nr:peptide ABC transporter substrate-binding protein [Clostridia bacterium]
MRKRLPERLVALVLSICLLAGYACAEEFGEVVPVETLDPWADFSAGSTINTDAELRLGYVAAAGAQVNPFLCTERDLLSLNSLVFESLVELDDSFKPTPLLADSWTVDGGTWTFKLREGVVFHNGMSLTAADVLLSYQSYIAAGETNPYYKRLQMIEEMEATDEFTVTVKTDEDASGYMVLYAMTFPVVQYGTLSETMARGTGPYWYTEYVSGAGVRLEANPLWWKKDTQIQSIAAICYADSGDALEALSTKEIDMLCTQSSNASFSRKMSAYTSMDYLTTTYEMIIPNLSEDSLMSDVRMRQAVMYAIDRAAIAENAYLGMGIQCEVPVNPGSWLYESQSAIYYYSPERALQLLQNCGWSDLTGDGMLNQVDGVRLKDLELRMIVYNESTNSIRENAANMIAEYLRQVGVKVNIEVRGKERVLRYINEGDYDIALVGVNLSEVPDLTEMFGSRGDVNLNSYGHEEMRNLLKLIPTAQTEDELKGIYSQIQMNIVERLPVMGLLFRTGTVLSRRSLAGLSGISSSNTLNGIEFMQSLEG